MTRLIKPTPLVQALEKVLDMEIAPVMTEEKMRAKKRKAQTRAAIGLDPVIPDTETDAPIPSN